MEKRQPCPWCAASGPSGDLLVLPSIRAMRPDESGSPFDKKHGQQMTIDQEAGQS